jgi:ABC-type bacteriocin/lantibiotic exporter with double-glycine peptidase domain
VIARDGADGRRGLLRRLVATHPSAYGYVAAAAALATVPGLAVPLLMRVFVDQYLISANEGWAAPIALGLIAALVVVAALTWLQYRVLARLSVRLSATESVRFTWRLLRMPVPTVTEFGAGDLTARSAALQRQAFLSGLLVPMALANLVTITVYTVAVIALDTVLGLAGLAVVVGSILVSTGLLRRRRVLQTRADASLVALSSATAQAVTSIETIKAAGWEPWVFDRWSQDRSAAAQANSALAVDGQRLGLVSPLTQTIGLGLILALGSLLVFSGQLTVGTLAASQTLLLAILLPAGQLVWIGTLIESVRSIQHQSDVIALRELDPEVTARPANARRLAGQVGLDLRSVTFGYDASEAPLLADLSVDVPAGTWLAVVGSSGSGKSTLSRLAIGELQPWSGAVLLDGVPRLDVPRQERALRVGYVPQYPVLMPGTIAENITMFDDSVPVEEIQRALSDARLLDAIASRAGGLEERVTATGHGFSGGELQRLAIARALVRDPGLLVLDEATSALDPVTEAEIGLALRERGCTCLVVAHRLSTVRDADRIVVLERGSIVQAGTFDELRVDGRFAELAHG